MRVRARVFLGFILIRLPLVIVVLIGSYLLVRHYVQGDDQQPVVQSAPQPPPPPRPKPVPPPPPDTLNVAERQQLARDIEAALTTINGMDRTEGEYREALGLFGDGFAEKVEGAISTRIAEGSIDPKTLATWARLAADVKQASEERRSGFPTNTNFRDCVPVLCALRTRLVTQQSISKSDYQYVKETRKTAQEARSRLFGRALELEELWHDVCDSVPRNWR